MDPIIGIDLGTTNSAAALLTPDGPQLIPNALGGRTFDVSVVELFEGTLELRASAGETSLGGEDFTRTLAARVLERLGESFERAEAKTPLLVSRLVQQCEQAKCRLSREETATVR